MSPTPPRLATWLLEHFDSRSEALVGDLVEEFHHGRSAAWYRRQVRIAIAARMWSDVRSHWVLALRAVLVGYIVLFAYAWTVMWPLWGGEQALSRQLGLTSPFWRATIELVNRFWSCGALAACGWMVARLHRPREGTMVLLFAACLIAPGLPALVRLAENTWQHQRYAPYFVNHAIDLMLVSSCVLFGGFIRAATRRKASTTSGSNSSPDFAERMATLSDSERPVR